MPQPHRDFAEIYLTHDDRVIVDGEHVATLNREANAIALDRFRHWIETFHKVVEHPKR